MYYHCIMIRDMLLPRHWTFDRTVAITGGMPILRTSVDHGTAFDIAGTGKASAVSLIEAILVASKYALSFTGKEK